MQDRLSLRSNLVLTSLHLRPVGNAGAGLIQCWGNADPVQETTQSKGQDAGCISLRSIHPEFRPLGRFAPVAVNSGLRPETRTPQGQRPATRLRADCLGLTKALTRAANPRRKHQEARHATKHGKHSEFHAKPEQMPHRPGNKPVKVFFAVGLAHSAAISAE